MNNLYVGFILQRKKFLTDDGVITVHKSIGYGYCSKNGDKFKFHSGRYKNQEFNELTSEVDIGIFFLDIENFLADGFSSIDDKVKIYYSANFADRYLQVDFDKHTWDSITYPTLIKKCKKAFDNIGCNYDYNENYRGDIIEDIDDEDDVENTFLQYDIEEKYEILKEHVFGQDEQLKQVLSCVAFNVSLDDSGESSEVVADTKTTILLLGNTGVGKTLMIKNIAKMFGIPYVIEDATRYTGSGWSGEDIENMLRNLYVASGKNITNAQMGILVVDEFDKLCKKGDKNGHATTAVQDGLLKLIEGTKLTISKNNHTDIGGFQFDTSKLTIILSGAFDGMDKIIEKRTNQKRLGFYNQSSDENDKNIDDEIIQVEDLIEYGVKKELAGRINNIIQLNNPSKEDLKNAFLYSKNSPLVSLENFLKSNGIKIEFDEDFVDIIVDKAITLKTGYRGLNKVFNDVVNRERYDIMTGKKKVLSLTSDKVK